LSLEQARAIEHKKYELAYQSAIYAMGSGRMTDALFRSWFSGEVTWVSKGRKHFSETWRVDLS